MNQTPPQLPDFPVDDFTLDQLEHALNTCIDGPMSIPFTDEPEAPRKLVGGEFTLSQFLDFMSGHDPKRATLVGEVDGIPIYESWDRHYSESNVMRALIAEIRRLRITVEEA